jgi:hypothetical protein
MVPTIADTVLQLSAELRNKIWAYALSQPEPIIVTTGSNLQTVKIGWQSVPLQPTALLLVSKNIYSETRLLFYHVNDFEICHQDSNPPEHFNEIDVIAIFLNTIGPIKAAAVGGLAVRIRRFFPYSAGIYSQNLGHYRKHIVNTYNFALHPVLPRLRPDCNLICHFRWDWYGPHSANDSCVDWRVDLRDLRKAFNAQTGVLPNWLDLTKALRDGLVENDGAELMEAHQQ